MSRLLFENSKFALGFAGVTLAGAAIFAATSDNSNLLGGDADEPVEVTGPSEDAPIEQRQPRATETADIDPEMAGFATDEQLINDTAGFDPAPSEIGEIEDSDFGDFDDYDDDDGGSSRSNSGSSKPALKNPEGDASQNVAPPRRSDLPDDVYE